MAPNIPLLSPSRYFESGYFRGMMESEILSFLSQRLGSPVEKLIAVPIYNSKDVQLRILKNCEVGRSETKPGAWSLKVQGFKCLKVGFQMYSDKLTSNRYFHKFTGKLREGFSRKVKLIQKLLNRMRDRISTLQYGVFAQTRKANEQDEDYRQVFNASMFCRPQCHLQLDCVQCSFLSSYL